MISQTIRKRLVIALTCILISSFLLLSIVNYKATKEHVRAELLSALPLTGETIYSEIHGSLMRPIFISSLMAHDTFLKEWVATGEKDRDRITRYLKEIQNKYDFFSTFFVSSKTRTYYHFNGILKQVSHKDTHDVWYYSFIDSGKEYRLDVDTNQAADNKLTIFVNFRVLDQNGDLLGVAGVGLNMNLVSAFLEKAKEKYGRLVYLVNRHGVVQAHPDMARMRNVNIHDLPGIGALADTMLAPGGEPSNHEYEADAGQVLVSVRYVPDFDWFLLVEQDVSQALAAARSNFRRTIIAGLLISLLVIIISISTVNHFQLRLEKMARTDELTGLANRRAFERAFERAVIRHKRHSTAFSLILLDLDSFKKINDTHGHLIGDTVLVEVAGVINNSIRSTDRPARWGGDEFIILVEGTVEKARFVAERIRRALKQADAASAISKVQLSASCGVSEYQADDDLDTITGRADMALYSAKRNGRDQVA